uniref:CXXC motif containing zinc binding protein isoform X2 n=1 Tax=Callithrix jacchus TaxID=9483 RepID=UPI0023DD24C9|nr:CXXC motif containing zinc binding protein isoform X2 [Callithrix jacchus]
MRKAPRVRRTAASRAPSRSEPLGLALAAAVAFRRVVKENRAAAQSHAREHHQSPACGRGLPVVFEDILSSTIKPYNAEDNENFKTIVEFECRGLEPVDFQPQAGFAAEGVESGTVFSDINLQEKDWTDYDEKAQESVGIYEVTHQFVKC